MYYWITILFTIVLTTSLSGAIAKITGLTGQASIERSSGSIPATLGLALESKDTIATEHNAKVQLTFADNTIITVGKQSRFSVEEYLYDNTQDSTAKFNMMSGTIRAMSGKIGKIAPDKFSVKTKTATIGIRGTDFIVFTSPEGDISIFCMQGAITVRSLDDKPMAIEAGKFTKVSDKGVASTPKEFTNDDIESLLDKGFKVSQIKIKDTPIAAETEPAVELSAKVLSLLNTDESLTRGSLNDVETLLQEAGITITTDTIPQIPAEPQTFTGWTTYLNRYISGGGLISGEGTLSITSTPATQSIAGEMTYFNDSILTLGETLDYTAIDSFESKIATWDVNPLPYSSHLTPHTDTENDYFAWGEWNIDPTDPTNADERITHGYWVAGVETPAAVFDAYRFLHTKLTYNGNVIGEIQTTDTYGNYVETTALTSGTISMNVDFATDSVASQLALKTATSDYAIQYNGTAISNQFNGSVTSFTKDTLPSEVSSGTLNGGFYGTTGKIAGGTFNANGNFGGSQTMIQGAFKAAEKASSQATITIH